MEFSDKTIVLRVGGFREADLWVRLLSASRGVFSAFAFGGSRSRRRFSGCLDIFNEVLFQVKGSERGPYMILQEGVLLKGPERLRTDWKRMGMAVNCALFVEAFGAAYPEPPAARGATAPSSTQSTSKNDTGMHGLFTSLLRLLETCEHPQALLPVFFRARLVCDQGYAIETTLCSACAAILQAEDCATLYSSGELLCPRCAADALRSAAGAQGRPFKLTPAGLQILRGVLHDEPEQWGLAPLPLADVSQYDVREASCGIENGPCGTKAPAQRGYVDEGITHTRFAGPSHTCSTSKTAVEHAAHERGLSECARALDAFVQFHTGLAWANGYFKRH